MKKRLLILMALLATIVTGASAQPHVGDILYSDGTYSRPENYDPSPLDKTKTAIAMIAYIGSDTGVDGFTGGLAIRLFDQGSAMPASTVATWNNHSGNKPLYGDWASKWLSVSTDQWQRMFIGCGSTSAFVPNADLTINTPFEYGNFLTLLQTTVDAIGEKNNQNQRMTAISATPSTPYWACGSENTPEWGYDFTNQKFVQRTSGSYYYRYVLAFKDNITESEQATKLPLRIGEKWLTEENASDVLGDGTVSYNKATNTLTLNNATLESVENWNQHYTWGGAAESFEGLAGLQNTPKGTYTSLNNLTINVVGNNTVDYIYAINEVSFNGTGKLTVIKHLTPTNIGVGGSVSVVFDGPEIEVGAFKNKYFQTPENEEEMASNRLYVGFMSGRFTSYKGCCLNIGQEFTKFGTTEMGFHGDMAIIEPVGAGAAYTTNDFGELILGIGGWSDDKVVVSHPGLPIDEEHFPDANFRAYISENRDTNHDGYLSDEESAGVTYIDVSGLGISDLTGIEYFTALKLLECMNNSITGSSMDNLIASLPEITGESMGDLRVIDETSDEEANTCTKEQILAAQAKGWEVWSRYDTNSFRKFVNHRYFFVYGSEGVEMTDMNIDNINELLTNAGSLKSGTVAFNPNDNRLTLTDATIEGVVEIYGYEKRGSTVTQQDVIVEVVGVNEVKGYEFAIIATDDAKSLTFTGTGILKVTGDAYAGICANFKSTSDFECVIEGPTIESEGFIYGMVLQSQGNTSFEIKSGSLTASAINYEGNTNPTYPIVVIASGTPSIELGKNIDVISPENVSLQTTTSESGLFWMTMVDADGNPVTGSIDIGYQEYYLSFDEVHIHSNNYDQMKEILTEKGILTKGDIQFNPQTGILLLNGAELKLNDKLGNDTRQGLWTAKRPEDLVYYYTPTTIEVQNDNLITGELEFLGGESAVKGDGTLRINGGLVFQDFASTFSLNDATLVLGSETLDMPALSSLCEALTLNLNSGRLELINNGAEGNQLVSLATVEGGAVINLGEGIIFSGNGTQIKTETTEYEGETIYITTLTDENGEPVNGSIVVDDEETLGIETVHGTRSTVTGKAYNLQGQRVGNSYRGIVIVNGKKVVR